MYILFFKAYTKRRNETKRNEIISFRRLVKNTKQRNEIISLFRKTKRRKTKRRKTKQRKTKQRKTKQRKTKKISKSWCQ